MIAKNSLGKDYECKYDWNCYCQCGDSGVVLSGRGSYFTAFFEAFPDTPKCFIRGEGKSVEEAENECWKKYLKIRSCNHEMERRGRTDGYGYCKHCGYSAMVFEPLTKCVICGKPTNYGYDKERNWYCKKHFRYMPKRLRNEWMEERTKPLPRKVKKFVKKGLSIKRYGSPYGYVKLFNTNFSITFEDCEGTIFTYGFGFGKAVRKLTEIVKRKNNTDYVDLQGKD